MNPLEIELNNTDEAIKYLRTVKATRLEGLIIENFFHDVFNERLEAAGYRHLDCMVLNRVIKKDNGTENEYLVMPRKDFKDYIILKHALGRTGINVKFLLFDRNSNRLYIHEMNDRFETTAKEDITPERPASEEEKGVFQDDNDDRISTVYWGYGKGLGKRFEEYCQEMIIKDHAIKAFNNYMWDFDKFYLDPAGKIIYLEIKHKYPTRNMEFGLNRGEKQQIDQLIKAGLKAYYVILVKPYWNKTRSSMYLFTDKEARERSTWIAGDLTEKNFFKAGEHYADRSTSIFGQYTISYYSNSIEKYSMIGSNREKNDVLAEHLINYLKAPQKIKRMTEDDLRGIQI